jgi:hypothetical protein
MKSLLLFGSTGSLEFRIQVDAGTNQDQNKPYPLSRTLLKVIAPVFRQFDDSKSFIMDS